MGLAKRVFVISVSILLTACQSSVSVSNAHQSLTATPQLKYAEDRLDLRAGFPQIGGFCGKLTAVPDLIGGAADAYSISPDLPSGLSLDLRMGSISGTPMAPSPMTGYQVTASGPFGRVSTTVFIQVLDLSTQDIALTDIVTYPFNGVLPLTLRQAIDPFVPTHSGDQHICSFAIDPLTPLPVGLLLNSVTGVISGTPTATSGSAVNKITAYLSGKWSYAVSQVVPSLGSSGTWEFDYVESVGQFFPTGGGGNNDIYIYLFADRYFSNNGDVVIPLTGFLTLDGIFNNNFFMVDTRVATLSMASVMIGGVPVTRSVATTIPFLFSDPGSGGTVNAYVRVTVDSGGNGSVGFEILAVSNDAMIMGSRDPSSNALTTSPILVGRTTAYQTIQP